MSEQYPHIDIPYKLPDIKPTIKFEMPSLAQDINSKYPIFPWVKSEQEREKEELNKKVQDIQSQLNPSLPKLSDKFIEKVIKTAEEIKCDPKDLLAIMYHESGGWDPSIVAKDKKGNIYGGLIQMTSDSLKAVTSKYAAKYNLKKNITMREYLKLPREKPIDYAKGYFTLLKDSCDLNTKERLTAGETWGMLKSPKQTKSRNVRFLTRLDNFVKKIKDKIFIPKAGQYLNVKN